MDGATDAELQQETKLKRRNVYRLITERCLSQAEDGTIQGWRGALPHMRVKEYARKSMPTVNEWGEGAVGSLQWLFSSASGAEIEAKFRKQILEKTRALESTKRSKQAHFRWFIEELRTYGYEKRGEWPFNVARMGFQTISIFIDKVLDENPTRKLRFWGVKLPSERQRQVMASTARRCESLIVLNVTLTNLIAAWSCSSHPRTVDLSPGKFTDCG